MRPALDYPAFFENDYLVTVAYRRKAVCDNDTGYAPVLYRLDHLVFCLCVKCAGRLIEYDYGRILRKHPRYLHSLALTSGKIAPAALVVFAVLFLAPIRVKKPARIGKLVMLLLGCAALVVVILAGAEL